MSRVPSAAISHCHSSAMGPQLPGKHWSHVTIATSQKLLVFLAEAGPPPHSVTGSPQPTAPSWASLITSLSLLHRPQWAARLPSENSRPPQLRGAPWHPGSSPVPPASPLLIPRDTGSLPTLKPLFKPLPRLRMASGVG